MIADDSPSAISLKSEDIAWDTLRAILDGKIDMEMYTVSFKEADWAKVHLVFEGNVFDQTATPSIMKGIVEFQNSLYRAAALVTKNDARATRLTDEEKDKYEIVFRVSGGSTDFLGEIKDVLDKLVEPLVKGMSPKQKYVLLILISLLFASDFSWSRYLDFVSETKKSSDDAAVRKSDNDREMGLQQLAALHANKDQEKFEILARALNVVRRGKTIENEALNAYDSIVRQSRRVDNLQVQGRSVSRSQIAEITRSQRRSSEKVNFSALYTIDRVETNAEGGFFVRLKNTQTKEIVNALLEERFLREKYGGVIQRAEWGKTIVNVTITGKRIGSEVVDAKILSAHRPRKKRRR